MATTYAFEGDLFWLRLEGTYTTEDVRNTLEAALADPRLPATPRFIFDVAQSQSLADRSTLDVQSMAAFLGSKAEAVGGRMAIVASAPLYFGLMRMGSVYAESHDLETEVFDNTEAAISWLDQAPTRQ